MPPHVKILKEDIVDAAIRCVRRSGADAINARSIAEELGCSTQPIFSNFTDMSELRLAVMNKADKLIREFIDREMKTGKYPEYKASGMAYIRFAKEEAELFKLLYMRDRTKDNNNVDESLFDEMKELVSLQTGLNGEKSKMFHFEMWTVVHGLATMIATDYLSLDLDFASKVISDMYAGLKNQHGV